MKMILWWDLTWSVICFRGYRQKWNWSKKDFSKYAGRTLPGGNTDFYISRRGNNIYGNLGQLPQNVRWNKTISRAGHIQKTGRF